MSAETPTETATTTATTANTEPDARTAVDPIFIEKGAVTVAGCGSLLSITSTQSTMPNASNFRVGRVDGFRRVFIHPTSIFYERGIVKQETNEASSISCEENEGSSFIVLLFDIPIEEYAELSKREEEFRLEVVDVIELESGAVDAEETGVCKAVLCCAWDDDSVRAAFCTRSQSEGAEEGGESSNGNNDNSSNNCGCVLCRMEPFTGKREIWTNDPTILPCRAYTRHCWLSAGARGKAVLDSFLDDTFLADRTTTMREHLDENPEILSELPPEEVRGRYSGDGVVGGAQG